MTTISADVLRHPTAPQAPDSGGVEGDAERRITRQFAVFVGVGFIAYSVMNIGNIVSAFHVMETWWALGAPIAVFGSGIAIGVAGIVGDPRGIRIATTTAAILYLVTVLLTPVAWTGVPAPADIGLWYATFSGLLAVALGLQPGVRPIVYLAVVSVAVVLCNTEVKKPDTEVAFIPELAFTFGYSMPYVCATVVGVRTARLLDTTRDATYRIAADTAAAQARSAERARFDALTHDGVMATLLGAARLGTTDDVRLLARRTLADLAEIATPGAVDETISATAAARLVRGTLSDVDDTLRPEITLPADPEHVHFPTSVVRTIAAATAEAVRNSIRHARAQTRSVAVVVDDTAISVAVTDDGQGFTPRDVEPHRLGIAVSIVGRMRQLSGGDAEIHSAPGQGCRVAISWRR